MLPYFVCEFDSKGKNTKLFAKVMQLSEENKKSGNLPDFRYYIVVL